MSKFIGFVRPKANYFRLPNDWTDITHDMTSLAEMKVVEYVLRHTWGYSGQEDRPRRISIDEFMHGRKKKGGGRVDRGTGLSAGAVSAGLKSAIEHGYLRMTEDDTDGGRVKRYYSLVMLEADTPKTGRQRSDFGGLVSDFGGIESGDQRSDFGGPTLENGGRSKKDNKGKDNLEKKTSHNTMFEPKGSNRTNNFDEPSNDEETQQPSPTESSNSPSLEDDLPRDKKEGKQPSSFDVRAAREFAEAVRCRRKVQKNSDLRQWANVFRQMRETDNVSKKDIHETIQWYAEHINDEFMPEAFSASTFRRKFADGQFESAMKRSSNGRCSSNGKRLTRENMWDEPSNVLPGGILKVEVGNDGKQYDGRLLHRIRRRVRERYGNGMPLPKQLEAVLTEEFPEAGEIPLPIIGSVG